MTRPLLDVDPPSPGLIVSSDRDKLLFAGIRRHEERAFSDLFLRYWDELVGYGARWTETRAEAEEVVQELFVRLWERADALAMPDSVREYLRTAVRRAAWMSLRRRRSWQRSQPLLHWANPPVPMADEALLMSECAERVERALQQLSPVGRRVFALTRTQSHADVASALGLSVDAVKSHVKRAFAAIRDVVVDDLCLTAACALR